MSLTLNLKSSTFLGVAAGLASGHVRRVRLGCWHLQQMGRTKHLSGKGASAKTGAFGYAAVGIPNFHPIGANLRMVTENISAIIAAETACSAAKADNGLTKSCGNTAARAMSNFLGLPIEIFAAGLGKR